MELGEKVVYLLPSCMRQSDGVGPVIDLGKYRGALLEVTLVINSVKEGGELTVSVWGSTDQSDFGMRPILSLPPKYYCGMYTAFLDLTKQTNLRYLRVKWKMDSWGVRHSPPVFGFEVSAFESHTSSATA